MARQRGRASAQRRPLRPRRSALSVSGSREQASARERADGAVTMFARMSGHGASDGKARRTSVSASQGCSLVCLQAMGQAAHGHGKPTGTRVSARVRPSTGRPAKGPPDWLGRDSCPTHHGTVRRQDSQDCQDCQDSHDSQDSQDGQDGHEGPTWPSVCVVDHTAVRPSVRPSTGKPGTMCGPGATRVHG